MSVSKPQCSSSGSGGFGGGGGGGPPKRPRYDKPRGIFDRYCCHCGWLIRNQVGEKPGQCPFQGCKGRQFLREGQFGKPVDWTRCVDCDSFLKDDMCYCQLCGRGQATAIQGRDRKAKAHAEAEKARMTAENRKLAEEAKKKEEELEASRAEIERLKELVKQQDAEIIVARHMGDIILESDDDMELLGKDSKPDEDDGEDKTGGGGGASISK